ncbi:MAG: hypothetical protein VXX85_03970 [Candidatus Margulisiibacteriota bacterium]|nr:hypothetical protein [Candidatus Margulisiibacteriota bacterium]
MDQSIIFLGQGFICKYFLKMFSNKFSTIITTSKSSLPLTDSTQHFHLDIYKAPITLPPSDIAVFTLPFSRNLKDPTSYLKGISNQIELMSKQTKVIFMSSTSVYPSTGSIVTEDTIIDKGERAQALQKTESRIMDYFDTSYILRLGGICGYERNSIKKITQNTIEYADTPINLIHIDDIIMIMMMLINSNSKSDIINICATEHPSRQQYYKYLCQTLAIKQPRFSPKKAPFKLVSNHHLKQTYRYKFIMDSPLEFRF